MKCFLALISIMSSVFFISLTTTFAEEYTVGVGDVLEIRILKPDDLKNESTVTPSGEVSVPYLGSINVKGKTITQIQRTIQNNLASGYLKYPVVVVSLLQSHSRNFTISGEVIRPGTYPLGEDTTVLKAVSIAGGFTRFGSKSSVKVLRPRKDKPGYYNIKVDLKEALNGNAQADIVIQAGDIIVISEGLF